MTKYFWRKVMFSVAENTEVANISEVRTLMSQIVQKVSEKKRIIVTKNNEPSMVILNFNEYQALMDLMEKYEDNYFGKIAADRLETFDEGNVFKLDDVEKLVGLK
jgi:prevent-host-death family protein